jgi:hypothetical protein
MPWIFFQTGCPAMSTFSNSHCFVRLLHFFQAAICFLFPRHFTLLQAYFCYNRNNRDIFSTFFQKSPLFIHAAFMEAVFLPHGAGPVSGAEVPPAREGCFYSIYKEGTL